MQGEQLGLNLFGQNTEDSDDFFIRKRAWSAAKHRIMIRYIQAHCYNLGGNQPFQSKYINYVDGFAGAGQYDEGIGIEDFIDSSDFWKRYQTDFLDKDGSPLLALKCARIFKEEERVNLRCFFTEEDKDNYQQLVNNCNKIGQDLEYTIFKPQEFSTALPEIMSELNNYPTIFFLDAFGVKGVNFAQICTIANYVSKNKGELFLLFHNRAVARHAGHYKTTYKDLKEEKAAKNYIQNLTNLLGSDSDNDWKLKWLQLRSKPQEFEKWALNYFKQRLRIQSSFRGVTSFEIKEKYNETRPQYSIVVGSNHPNKAFGEFLNEFIVEENKLLFYKTDKTGANKKFLDDQWNRHIDGKISDIRPKIIEILPRINTDWMVLKEVITLLIIELSRLDIADIGYLKRPEYRKIMLELHKEKIIQAESLGKKGELTLENRIKVV